jgi:glycosyltransferase involved in cell wall biosynthesis
MIRGVCDVVLPVLNEAAALPWVLTRMPPGFRPIVVDNGSTDGSGTIARRLGAGVVDEPMAGFGAACWAGLQAATAAIVCFMDADASLDPQDLPSVVLPVRDEVADLVVGARVPEAGAWPPHARLANRLIAWEIGRRSGHRLTDLGPMRAARLDALRSLDLRDRRFGWPFEMVLKAGAEQWRVQEVPVSYRRRTGVSKVTGTVRGTARAVRDLAGVMR